MQLKTEIANLKKRLKHCNNTNEIETSIRQKKYQIRKIVEHLEGPYQ